MMHNYQVTYYNILGDTYSVLIQARNEKTAIRRFRERFGYFEIDNVKEVHDA